MRVSDFRRFFQGAAVAATIAAAGAITPTDAAAQVASDSAAAQTTMRVNDDVDDDDTDLGWLGLLGLAGLLGLRRRDRVHHTERVVDHVDTTRRM
jgi:MYXO-CTERM domain-containing protein